METRTITERYEADAALVARIHNQDPKAEAEFYTKYVTQVRQWVRKFLGNTEAEDVAHDIFTKALIYLRKGTHKIKALLGSWLYSITKNECINLLRRRKVVQRKMGKQVIIGAPSEITPNALPIQVKDPYPTPLEILQQKDHLEIILKKIASLSKKRRQSFTDFHIDELSFKEMAIRDGYDTRCCTHRTQCFFARKELRKDPELRMMYYGKV